MNCGLNYRGASLPDVLGGQTLTMKMAVALGAIALTLVGCGTVTTVLQEDADAARGLRRQKTYCQSIPRVYSGVAFDFCLLNAQPDFTGVLVPAVLVDIVASGAVDTVLLPYTIYRQSTDGKIGIYWQARRS